MPHDVFISYSSKDRVIADAIVSNFEKNGIRCWYAPRDIGPGDDWGKAITKAIDASSVFLLIFSGNANSSKHVLDELYYCLAEEKIVIPFRVENLNPSGAMRLHLSSLHWLDAYAPSWEAHIDRLFETVSANHAMEISQEREKFVPPDGVKPSPWTRLRGSRVLFAIVLVAIISLSIAFGIPLLRGNSNEPAGTEQAAFNSPTTDLATSTWAPLPTSTPDPTLTPIPWGSAEHPIIWMFPPDPFAEFDEINAAMREVVAAFDVWSDGKILKLVPAVDSSAIVSALCDGETNLGSLNALPYLVASDRGCATVRYIWAAHSDINYGGMVVVRSGGDIADLTDLIGKTVCIPDFTSTSGWLLPSLELRAAGIDPMDSRITIVEAGGHDIAIQKVYDDECDAGTAFYDARQLLDIETIEEDLTIIAYTVAIPNQNISFASTLDENTSLLLEQFLAYLASDEGNPDAMAIVAGYSATTTDLIDINEYYYDGLRDLIERAGLTVEEALQLMQ